jgi:hypothetical protein
MRFFKDDLAMEMPVTWYFTDPKADWCGKANIFNSRNWYKGELGWPDLGEVEGAPRPWADGEGLCLGHPGPFGSDLEWEDGTYLVDRVPFNPCVAEPTSLGFSETRCQVEYGISTTHDMVRHGDNWTLPYPHPVAGPDWFTITAKKGGVCCFARGTTAAITGPPPAFTVLRTPDVTVSPFNSCTVEEFNDPVAGVDIFVICDI